jgi:uncharacterized membrane protein YagU involved in acid resistance
MTQSEQKLDIGIRIRAFTRQDGVVILGGALAGLLGALALLAVLTLGAVMEGHGFVHPLKLIATTAFGPRAVDEPATASVIVTGLFLHFTIGAAFGVVFGYLADGFHPVTAMREAAFGLAYGLAIFLVMFFYVVPSLAPVLAEQARLASLIGHLAFGATVALAWPITERLHHRGEELPPIPLPVV